jgi:hypothetical protein
MVIHNCECNFCIGSATISCTIIKLLKITNINKIKISLEWQFMTIKLAVFTYFCRPNGDAGRDETCRLIIETWILFL